MTSKAVVGGLVLFLLLGGFFAWVLYEMAWASSSMERLFKLGIAFGCVGVVAPLLYLLLKYLGRWVHH